jgi:hypothetical protein
MGKKVGERRRGEERGGEGRGGKLAPNIKTKLRLSI